MSASIMRLDAGMPKTFDDGSPYFEEERFFFGANVAAKCLSFTSREKEPPLEPTYRCHPETWDGLAPESEGTLSRLAMSAESPLSPAQLERAYRQLLKAGSKPASTPKGAKRMPMFATSQGGQKSLKRLLK